MLQFVCVTSMEEDHIRQEAGGDARGPADEDQVWPMEERVPEEGLLLNLLSLLRQTAGGNIPAEHLPQLLTGAAQASQSLHDALGCSGAGATAANESRPQNDELNDGCTSALAQPEGAPLSGLGFATFTSSAHKHKRWIAHAAILCQARAHKLTTNAVVPLAAAGGIADAQATQAPEGFHESVPEPDDQQEGEKQCTPRTCKLYSLVDFGLASLGDASSAGFKRAPWTQFGMDLKDLTCSESRPGEGVLQYEQLSGVEGDSMQNSVLAVALHVFNEAEVPKKAAQQASSNQAANRQGAGGRDVPESSSVQYERSQPVSDALTTRAVAAQRRVKVPKLSQRSEQKLVQTALHKALQDLKTRGDGMFGLNKVEIRMNAAIPALAFGLSATIMNAASALLPFTCNILACDSDELHVRLHNKICEVVAQEIQHIGPNTTDVNPAAGRGGSQQGEELYQQQQQHQGQAQSSMPATSILPYPSFQRPCKRARPLATAATPPGLLYIDDAAGPHHHPVPSSSQFPQLSLSMQAGQGDLCHMQQPDSDAMIEEPAHVPYHQHPTNLSAVALHTTGGGYMASQTHTNHYSSTHQQPASHRDNDLLQRAQQLYNIRPVRSEAVQQQQQQESTDNNDDWLL